MESVFPDGYLWHIFFVQMMQNLQNKMFTIVLNHYVLTNVMKKSTWKSLPWCLGALTSDCQIHHENLDCEKLTDKSEHNIIKSYKPITFHSNCMWKRCFYIRIRSTTWFSFIWAKLICQKYLYSLTASYSLINSCSRLNGNAC